MSADKLRDLIEAAKRIVIFTGAGISTESGIPDFRSPGGVWDRFKPVYFQDFMDSEEMRRETWRRKIETDKTMKKAEPNRGHRAVEKLVREGKVSRLLSRKISTVCIRLRACPTRRSSNCTAIRPMPAAWIAANDMSWLKSWCHSSAMRRSWKQELRSPM